MRVQVRGSGGSTSWGNALVIAFLTSATGTRRTSLRTRSTS